MGNDVLPAVRKVLPPRSHSPFGHLRALGDFKMIGASINSGSSRCLRNLHVGPKSESSAVPPMSALPMCCLTAVSIGAARSHQLIFEVGSRRLQMASLPGTGEAFGSPGQIAGI